MKKVVCTLLVLFTSSIFAQQTESKPDSTTNGKAEVVVDVTTDTKVDIVKPVEGQVTRVFLAYTDFSSGVINPNDFGLNLFSGNEVEFGFIYEQNFARAANTKVGVKGYFITTVDVLSSPTNVTGVGSKGIYIKEPSVGIFTSGKNYRIEVDSMFRFKPSIFYTLNFKQAGRLTFYAGAEICMLGMPNSMGDSSKEYQHLQLFDMRLSYNVMLTKTLRLGTEVRFRFNGKGGGDVAPDSTQAFVNSFNIRWNNTLTYMKDGFYLYGQLRYQPERIAHATLDPVHKVSLHTGLGFTFNYSQNK
ncbi:MAG: hypothetical protein ACRCY4_07505 [Brevinema sp.]